MTPEWAKTAKVGDKVVCVGKICQTPFLENIPDIGRVYTIRKVKSVDGRIGFHLNEITNNNYRYRAGYFGEAVFSAASFKPVQTRKTDISIFHEILKSVSERISA